MIHPQGLDYQEKSWPRDDPRITSSNFFFTCLSNDCLDDNDVRPEGRTRNGTSMAVCCLDIIRRLRGANVLFGKTCNFKCNIVKKVEIDDFSIV